MAQKWDGCKGGGGGKKKKKQVPRGKEGGARQRAKATE